MEFKIVDYNGAEIKLDTKLQYGVGYDESAVYCKVVAISDPDGDYDDELGRAVEIPPRLTVEFDDGTNDVIHTMNITKMTWACYPDGPAEYEYEASDDVEVK